MLRLCLAVRSALLAGQGGGACSTKSVRPGAGEGAGRDAVEQAHGRYRRTGDRPLALVAHVGKVTIVEKILYTYRFDPRDNSALNVQK